MNVTLNNKKHAYIHHTETEQAGQSYPAGAVDGGKLLICETRQSVCMTSNMRTMNYTTI